MRFEIDMTPRPIRVLHLEDSPHDAALVHELRQVREVLEAKAPEPFSVRRQHPESS